MDKEKINQMVKEMTELCKNTARSAVMFAGSPTGKVLFTVVLTVLIDEPPGIDRFWWKPPTN